jgi:hypothetical protein
MTIMAEGAKDFARITVTGTTTTKMIASIHINFFEERVAMPDLLLLITASDDFAATLNQVEN